ncbi:MAG: hypothetical protein ABW104_20915 [Candidatus Thiodiazotropha sp. 6PLUC2]
MLCSAISSPPENAQPPYQAVDAPIGILLGIGGELGVDRRALGALMAHLLLNRAQGRGSRRHTLFFKRSK